jgi:hypothetical protein
MGCSADPRETHSEAVCRQDTAGERRLVRNWLVCIGELQDETGTTLRKTPAKGIIDLQRHYEILMHNY